MADRVSANPRIDAAKKALADTIRPARRAAHRALGPVQADVIREIFLEARRAGLPMRPGDTVSGFWPIQDEIDIRKLLERLHEDGMAICLPVTGPSRAPLVFRAWRPGDEMAAGPMGLAEPMPEKKVLEPDMLIVPLLAFDRFGNRLGYGGGYYDATLADLRRRRPVVAVGVGFHAQQVETVPVDPGDERLDWIVTEKRVNRAERG